MEYLSERVMEVNSNIVEYDIRHANTSLMRYYNLAPIEFIDKLDSYTKMKREVYVGNLQRDDKEFSKDLLKSFDDMMQIFLSSNNLSIDSDILAIKKDAAFVINKIVNKTDFGGCVHFASKNKYKHYIRIGMYECYVKEDRSMDVKGIGDRDALDLHKDGILKFINDVIDIYISNDKNEMNSYLHEFTEAYKKRELPFDFYREFNSQSVYKYYDGENEITLDEIDESTIDCIDIGWNYFNVILPTIRLFV